MSGIRVRPLAAVVVSLLCALGLVAAACAPPPPPAAPSFTFKATSVTAIDQTEFIWGVNRYDEPYLANIWFRVKIGVANSAQAGVVSTRSASPEPEVCKVGNQGGFGYCDAGTETYALSGAQQGQYTFGNVSRPDILDLLNPANTVEVVGVWSWAMEEDWVGNPLPGTLATTIQSVLNATLAQGTIPGDVNDLAQVIIDDLGNAIALGGSALLNLLTSFLFGIGDDLLSSRMYVFVGSTGTLAGLLDAASVDLTGFNLDVQSAGIPNIAGVTIRSTNPTSLTNQAYVGAGADHRYDYSTS